MASDRTAATDPRPHPGGAAARQSDAAPSHSHDHADACGCGHDHHHDHHHGGHQAMPVRSAKVGRNEPCPCGSGQKYKKCCLARQG